MDKIALKIIQEDGYLSTYENQINSRLDQKKILLKKILGKKRSLSSFATGADYFGLHKSKKGWVFREWAPNATNIFLIGEFSKWKDDPRFSLHKIDENGVWEIELEKNNLSHGDFYKLSIHWEGGSGERIPSYANYVIQDEKTHYFCSQVYSKSFKFKNDLPKAEKPILIYEAHIGMAGEKCEVASYKDFQLEVLPRIKKLGYNVIQLMAIKEHPYYGSFGYQVSNFFAPSSRFGTPNELKELIDAAHGEGIAVIMDLVHSHAVKNILEGLAKFDGTSCQYFHDGAKGDHPSWDTKCFNYGKDQVIHFLLSNCKYWIEKFNFDGYRFDGITSMIYWDHGLGKAFSSYNDYFDENVDEDALIYLSLANDLIHELKPDAISIAEDMSGLPGISYPSSDGGVGFDYRLAMGIPDQWIKLLKEVSDHDWSMDLIWHELTNRRWNEGLIGYCESHDQALVGDKSIIFWLADKDMYTNFSKNNRNLIVDRALALHKMIRFITLVTARDGYLTFMGNEFGHPEWIDFPREGNDWSYQYARRQWSLVDKENLCYEFLNNFDKAMIDIISKKNIFKNIHANKVFSHNDDKILMIEREGTLFVFNFHHEKSYTGYNFYLSPGRYREIFNSDCKEFGGFERLKIGQEHEVLDGSLSLYLPSRTVVVLETVK